jgi:Animal haem peroxidase
MGHFCSHCVTPVVRAEAGEDDVGMFGRLFPDLPPLALDPQRDLTLGRPGGPMDASATEQPGADAEDNPRIAAGWTFFGQILAHDVTHDRNPLREKEPVERIRNYRSPRLDLEVVYGSGPVGQPYLYSQKDSDKLLIGRNDRGEPNDLPRNPEGLAIIGDPRNDTYIFISQLQVMLLKLHNLLVDIARAAGVPREDVFALAQQLARWHYQWIIIHEYLPMTVGEDLLQEVLLNEPRIYHPRERLFVPVEFSGAAFRFGHSQVRSRYDVNDGVRGVPIFPDMVGQRPVTAALRPDWRRFFHVDGQDPQATKRVDIAYAGALVRLPRQLTGELEHPEHASLAYRDLMRGSALELPSGEDVARALGERPLSRADLGLPRGVCPSGTPLCYYVLREAEVETGGKHLGKIGGRLVAEVVVGLLRSDPTAYLNVQPDWKPTLGPNKDSFTMADLLRVTGSV